MGTGPIVRAQFLGVNIDNLLSGRVNDQAVQLAETFYIAGCQARLSEQCKESDSSFSGLFINNTIISQICADELLLNLTDQDQTLVRSIVDVVAGLPTQPSYSTDSKLSDGAGGLQRKANTQIGKDFLQNHPFYLLGLGNPKLSIHTKLPESTCREYIEEERRGAQQFLEKRYSDTPVEEVNRPNPNSSVLKIKTEKVDFSDNDTNIYRTGFLAGLFALPLTELAFSYLPLAGETSVATTAESATTAAAGGEVIDLAVARAAKIAAASATLVTKAAAAEPSPEPMSVSKKEPNLGYSELTPSDYYSNVSGD
ncbi:hypothetical protein K1X76_00400 [bacterium]|nr:hypothetical protein [bacterium]